jgi:RNA polymerase sigma factor (sigma-70 family)
MTVSQYNECVHLYADNLYRFTYKTLQQDADSKDVMQHCFEKLWIHREQIDATKLKSYLFTSAYNKCIDIIRGRKKTIVTDTLPQKTVQINTQTDLGKLLQKALQTLNETQRMLVMLKDYEGYSYEEITTITKLNESQVKVYLHRARLQLKNYLVSKETII